MSWDKKYKRYIFLACYALYMVNHVISMFFGDIKSMQRQMTDIEVSQTSGRILGRLNLLSLYLLFGVPFVILVSMGKRRITWSRPVKFLAAGMALWFVWGMFIMFGDLAFFTSFDGRRELITQIIFTCDLFMMARVVEVYDLRKELTGITAFVLGTALLFAYVTHFNGLEFLDSISNILSPTGRYRISFGLGHYNQTGRTCLEFFMFTAIYRVLLRDSQRGADSLRRGRRFKYDALYIYLLFLTPIVVIMLISCASRTSITSITGFFLVYAVLGKWSKIRYSTKAMIFTVLLLLIVVLVAVLDLDKIWANFTVYSLRSANYSSTLPLLTAKRTWLAGFGFGFLKRLDNMRYTTSLDSFYLWTLLQTGLVGFFLLIGTILCFTFMYFRNTRNMTKVQRFAGGMLAAMLWYGLFEQLLFRISAVCMMEWLMIITATDERYASADAVSVHRNLV